jgi:hypothetical protein
MRASLRAPLFVGTADRSLSFNHAEPKACCVERE